MHYTDFSLLMTETEIVKSDKKWLQFKLHLPGLFPDPFPARFDVRELEELKQAAVQTDATWQEVTALGLRLSEVVLPELVPGALSERITQAQGEGAGIRIRLLLSGSEINNVPWEFLLLNRGGGEVKPTDFLALMPNVSIVRHAQTPLPAWKVEATMPAKMVVALASPAGWPKLKLAKERSAIEQALQTAPNVQANFIDHVKIADLPNKANPTHLFHFAGHGNATKEPSEMPGKYEGQGTLVLEDQYGDAVELVGDLLAVQLREAGVRVAVLGACLTAQRDDINVWSSVAEALLKAELGAVVGMQFPVLDGSAIAFAKPFYMALLTGQTIDEAVNAGRSAVAMADDARGWATPTLYLRAADGVIFPEYSKAESLNREREQASLDISMTIQELAGKATGVEIERMASGKTRVTMKIDLVTGKVVGAQIREMGGGAVHVEETIGTVEEGGSVIGASIDNFGGAKPMRTARGRSEAEVSNEVEQNVENNVGGLVVGVAEDKIVRGDEIHGNKVDGNQYNVGNISNVSGVAIGEGAHASVTKGFDANTVHIGTMTIVQGGTSLPQSLQSGQGANAPLVEEQIRLDVACPESAQLEEPFDVAVAVRQPDAPPLALAELEQVVSGEGSVFRTEDDQIVRYRVKVSASGCIVVPEEYVFKLRPRTNSRPVFFQVIPQRPGRRTLIVSAYQDDESVAAQTQVRIEVQVPVDPG